MTKTAIFENEMECKPSISSYFGRISACDPKEEVLSDLLAFEDSDLVELVISLS